MTNTTNENTIRSSGIRSGWRMRARTSTPYQKTPPMRKPTSRKKIPAKPVMMPTAFGEMVKRQAAPPASASSPHEM